MRVSFSVPRSVKVKVSGLGRAMSKSQPLDVDGSASRVNILEGAVFEGSWMANEALRVVNTPLDVVNDTADKHDKINYLREYQVQFESKVCFSLT